MLLLGLVIELPENSNASEFWVQGKEFTKTGVKYGMHMLYLQCNSCAYALLAVASKYASKYHW